MEITIDPQQPESTVTSNPEDITNANNKTIYINYFDSIDAGRVKAIMGIVAEILVREKPSCLYFLFASNGGSVDAGITLYNFLKALPIKVIMYNIGTIDSIANVIFVAGSERYAAPHATFLFHGVTWGFSAETNLSLPQINEIRDRIHKNHATIAGIICSNTSMTEKEIEKLFNEGETKDVSFALEKGIIHEVKAAQIPQDALFISINING